MDSTEQAKNASTGKNSAKSRDQLIRWLVTATAMISVLLKLFCPTLGDRIDLVTVGLLAVIFIPWISGYISKISIPGVIEAELRELKQEVQTTKLEAQNASEIARRSQDSVLLDSDGATAAPTTGHSSEDQLLELGAAYVKCRREMPSGAGRTTAMDRLFGKMLNVAKGAGPDWEKHTLWLQDSDPAKQLPAIAYAYAFSERTDISALLDVIEQSKQPFVQYWGLRAVQRAIDMNSPLSLKDMERLQKIEVSLRSGTDRFLLASSINRTIDGKLRS